MSIQAIGIIISFIIFVILMMKRICPMAIGFPLMALAVAAIVGLPIFGEGGFFATMMDEGAVRNATHVSVLLASAWLGGMMMVTGISKRIIKLAAELGGDRPFLVTILVIIAVAACMTTISGLGAVVMLGSIAIPIMINVGVPGIVAASAFLFAYAIGLTVNMGNWAYFSTVTSAGFEDVQTFALILMGITAAVTLLAIIIMFKRYGVKFSFADRSAMPEGEDDCEFDDSKVPIPALFTPLVPLVLVLFTNCGTVASFTIALFYCILSLSLFSKQYRLSDMLNRVLMKAATVGITGAAIVVIQSVLCGVLLQVLATEEVSNALTGVVTMVFPKTQVAFILFFALLAPLALFRGPTNIWGVGAAIATMLVNIGILPANAVMAAYISCERTQVIADPTNTHNIWIAGYVGTDVMTLLRKVLPYSWLMSALGATVAGLMFF